MLAYMLDADTVSLALRGQGNVESVLLTKKPSEVCISSITLAELRFGERKRISKKLKAAIDTFVHMVQVIPFDAAAADSFGSLAAKLEKKGTRIGSFDTMLAAHSLALGTTFVTSNLKHFQRVKGLRVESWK